MALPVTISSVTFPDQNYFCGPFIDGNGNVYIVLNDTASGGSPEMHKATDPTSSFSEVDAAGAPTDEANMTLWAFQDGDTIHIIYLGDGVMNVRYATFTTSDHGSTPDEWVIDELIESPSDTTANVERSTSIVRRSDSTVVAIYSGDTDSVMGNPFGRVDYNIRSSGGTWGGPVTLVADAKLAVDWFGSVAVLDTDNDTTHFFFKDATTGGPDNKGKHRSLTSGDSLGTVEDTGNQWITDHVFGPGIFFLDGSTHRIRVPVVNSSDEMAIIQVDDDGTPSEVDVGDADVFDVNGYAAACLAVDGTTAHMLFSRESDQDIFHDQANTPQDASDWGTDTEFLDAVTINRISCNVIDRSGKKLAMVYDNAGTIQYNEKDIAVVGGATHPGWVSSLGGWF